MERATTPMRGGDARSLLDGGFPAWPLPPGDHGPAFARHVVRSLLTELGLPPTTIYDAAVTASELATNIHLHATHPTAPPELWAHLRHSEIVFEFYDSAPWHGHPPRTAPPDAENGRGFEVVNALTAEHHGSWGIHPAHSRLTADPIPGKAVYFTLPLCAEGQVIGW